MHFITTTLLQMQAPAVAAWKHKLCYWMHFTEKYVFADWQFLNFFVVLVTIDTVLGWYKACKGGSFSIKLLHMLIQKIIIYICFLVLVHIVSHFTIEGEKNSFFTWFNSFAYSAIIVRESISVLENMGAIRPGLIPSWILKKLKQFDKDGFFTARPGNKTPKIKQKITQ
jgi:phage-related holin